MTDEIQTQREALMLRPQMAIGEALTVQDIVAQKELIQQAMKSVMKEGHHFGKIPGCGDKPTLLKPGAETIIMLFQMCPDYDIEVVDLGRGHREYRVKCILKSLRGTFLGSGVGSCSTMESKYRFRVGPAKLTDQPVPGKYWQLRKTDPKGAQELLGGPGHRPMKNDDGIWFIAERSADDERVEHDNPADNYNTCLKMARKRAQSDAVLTRTGASDIFAQDLEDLRDNLQAYEGKAEAQQNEPEGQQNTTEGLQNRPAGPAKPQAKPAAGGSQTQARPAAAAPAGTLRSGQPAVDDESRKAKWLKLLAPLGEFARQYGIENGWILPNEELAAISPGVVPKTQKEAERILNEIQQRMDSQTPASEEVVP